MHARIVKIPSGLSVPRILGLDIGGANLKAASLDKKTRTLAFPLWKHPERLSSELERLCADFPPWDQLAITMTGELCDCFATAREGVRAILESVRAFAAPKPIRVWSKRGYFLEWNEAVQDPFGVAAANWLALAHLVADKYSEEPVLLIDTGSTTTDLVYLHYGLVQPQALMDWERMQVGELVYTGVRRTPVCSVLNMQVAAEWFATMLDAYLCWELVPENPEDHDTADGRPATRACAHARLARLRCADVETFSFTQAQALAKSALEVQWRRVGAAVTRVLQGRDPVRRTVLSGSGEILARMVCAQHPSLAAVSMVPLSKLYEPGLSEAACAYAVAKLSAREYSEQAR